MERTENHPILPLVSAVITCYNHGRFLADAVQSLIGQTYRKIEIIVVDDGSTDDTASVALSFPEVKYIHQLNAGLSAARNTGIDNSTGSFLVFLDADDWLYPDAISVNLDYLQQHPLCAFVSGWHDKVDEWGYALDSQDEQEVIMDCHYLRMLWGNYIGMHATVLYQRRVFDEFRYDTTLNACEDYDMYFRIARKYPVGNHAHKLAAYRIHGKNMSANVALMLKHVLLVCHRQKPFLKNNAEWNAYHQGLKIWREYYSDRLYSMLDEEAGGRSGWPGMLEISLLSREKPLKLLAFLTKKANNTVAKWAGKQLPDAALKFLHRTGLHKEYVPAAGRVDAGDFARVTPFSDDFGFDRGGAIDRFYIENFIQEHRHTVHGHVLEIGDNEYTIKYGKDTVRRSEILHVDSSNPRATYVGDITCVPQIPSGYFDCIIFTQTLHLIYDFKSALQTCYRILKPGGCLLLTVPGISQVDKGPWKEHWLWSFTDTSMRRLMSETFNGSAVDIRSYGNVHVASAFLYGMGLPEIRKNFLLYNDPSYQVIISVKAIKS